MQLANKPSKTESNATTIWLSIPWGCWHCINLQDQAHPLQDPIWSTPRWKILRPLCHYVHKLQQILATILQFLFVNLVLPDQVLPQKIHFVMRGCRQQHLKAKAFLFRRDNKEGTCFIWFPCFGWPDFSEIWNYIQGKSKFRVWVGGRGSCLVRRCAPHEYWCIVCSCLGTKIVQDQSRSESSKHVSGNNGLARLAKSENLLGLQLPRPPDQDLSNNIY